MLGCLFGWIPAARGFREGQPNPATLGSLEGCGISILRACPGARKTRRSLYSCVANWTRDTTYIVGQPRCRNAGHSVQQIRHAPAIPGYARVVPQQIEDLQQPQAAGIVAEVAVSLYELEQQFHGRVEVPFGNLAKR